MPSVSPLLSSQLVLQKVSPKEVSTEVTKEVTQEEVTKEVTLEEEVNRGHQEVIKEVINGLVTLLDGSCWFLSVHGPWWALIGVLTGKSSRSHQEVIKVLLCPW